MNKNCKQCSRGFNFRACPSDVSSGRGNYCSNVCKAEGRRKLPKEFTCEKCGKRFPNVLGKIMKFCSRLCRYVSQKGKLPPNTGIPMSVEQKKLLSTIKKEWYEQGNTPWNKGMKGYKQSLETGIKISARLQGIRIEDWQGHKTHLTIAIRMLSEYDEWRRSIFVRDKRICVFCGIKGGWNKVTKDRIAIQADHIKPFSIIVRENKIKTLQDAIGCSALWDINNGRTLCVPCHKTTPTYGINAKFVKI